MKKSLLAKLYTPLLAVSFGFCALSTTPANAAVAASASVTFPDPGSIFTTNSGTYSAADPDGDGTNLLTVVGYNGNFEPAAGDQMAQPKNGWTGLAHSMNTTTDSAIATPTSITSISSTGVPTTVNRFGSFTFSGTGTATYVPLAYSFDKGTDLTSKVGVFATLDLILGGNSEHYEFTTDSDIGSLSGVITFSRVVNNSLVTLTPFTFADGDTAILSVTVDAIGFPNPSDPPGTVPVPAALPLLASALAILGSRYRRHRQA